LPYALESFSIVKMYCGGMTRSEQVRGRPGGRRAARVNGRRSF
jgi:hypothetical protein